MSSDQSLLMEFIKKWGPVIAIGTAMFTMFGWTWARWVDPFTDLGRELYVPWQLSLGKILYRDIAYFNGPLSPYFNSLWFRAFGPGFWVLVTVNCSLIVVMTLLLFYVCQYLADRFAATVACIVFVSWFAFAVLIPEGNFTYTSPYSHEATHGILLCLGILAALVRFLQTRRIGYFFLIALCTGLLQLTKIEMSLAGLATGGCAAGFLIWQIEKDKTVRWQMIALFALGLFSPAIVAFILLALSMPFGQAFKGALAPFLAFTYDGLTSMPFYQAIMGLDFPILYLKNMIQWAFGFLAVIVWVAAWAKFANRHGGWRALVSLIMALAPTVLLSWLRYKITWGFFAHPYGLLLVIGLAWGMIRWWKNRHDALTDGKYVVGIVFAVLSLSLLPKMLLNQRIYLYGFCLGMPATIVFVLAFMRWIPRMLQNAGGAPNIFKTGMMSVIILITVIHIQGTNYSITPRKFSMGEGMDFMVWGGRAIAFNTALKAMDEHIAEGETFAALPACVMFNYMARIPNSTPYIMCIPPEMAMFGEDKILAAYKKMPPDFILLVDQDNTQYGAQFFGKDYGQDFYNWIVDSYDEVAAIGPRPFQERRGGFLLMKRKAGSVPAG